MTNSGILHSFLALKRYCEKEGFKGWDPFDGLNSRVFQALPGIRTNGFCRLATIQLFKRNPINLRRIALVPKQYNSKGIGLFLQGYCNLYDIVTIKPELAKDFGTKEELLARINKLAELLISLKSKGEYHGACWGYNFGWKNRTGFYFPPYTPTVVATCFCSTALISAYEITKNEEYLNEALSSAEFVLHDLHRTECEGGVFMFSYSPLEGHNTIYNASLLGSRILSNAYHYTHNEDYKEAARLSALACCNGQKDDGSWPYGTLEVQQWVDSFHTGYNLDGLIAYQELCEDKCFSNNIDRGFKFYLTKFFDADGSPNYYHNQKYPIDIHCPGQLLVTLHNMHKMQQHKELADKVVEWTLKNMQSKKGYFYYQLKKGMSSHISYMRWSNAFMFYALSYYLRYE